MIREDTRTHRIPPRSGVAIELGEGDFLTVFDPEGMQVSDLVAMSRADPREIISNGRTFDYEETTRLTSGSSSINSTRI